MKKTLSVALVLVVMLCACNRKEFVKKLVGTWKISHYIYAGQDETPTFADTTNVQYTLVLSGNNNYQETWSSLSFRADSTIFSDTLGYDSLLMTYRISYHTARFVDTTVTKHTGTGMWALINSEEDLELLPSTDSTARMFNILTLTTSSLNLLNGNMEYDLVH